MICIIWLGLNSMKPIGSTFKKEDILPRYNALRSGVKWRPGFMKNIIKTIKSWTMAMKWDKLFTLTTRISSWHVITFGRFMKKEEIKLSSFAIISLLLNYTQKSFIFHILVEKLKNVSVTISSLTLEMDMKSTASSSQELVIQVLTFPTPTSSSKWLPTLVPEDKKRNASVESCDQKKVQRNRLTLIKTNSVRTFTHLLALTQKKFSTLINGNNI